ncbi:MAG: ABC transporter substrate-binding protein [Clostridiales bacterium]|nr:ABC transporter substrate-binding protein [Clostridiales bacterium]
MKGKLIIILIAISVILSGCNSSDEKVIKIAQQYGLAYAPLELSKELGLIEKYLPDYEIQWKQIMNTATIREGMLSSDLDIGFMGIPPFLIGVDNEMGWRIFRGLSEAPVGMTINTNKVTTLDDFDANHKIALPQPGSIQHILLSMFMEKNKGQADALDDYLISMAHPDGQIALLSASEVSAHFSSPPYIFEELKDDNIKLLIDGKDAFGGEFTFIVGVVKENFKNDEVIVGINKGIDEAVEMIKTNPEKVAELMAPVYGLDEETTLLYLTNKDMDYSNEVKGVDRFSEFMFINGYLEENVLEEDVFYEK